MAVSSCAGAKEYSLVAVANTELPPPSVVTLSKGTVVACVYLLNGMCQAFPHAKGGSPSIIAPGIERAICDGPNPQA